MFFNRKHRNINIDITYRCPLECLRCGRQTSFRNNGLRVPGEDMSIDDFNKITDHFPGVSFCGQYSDPIHHPKFIDMLDICREKNIETEVHVASSLKPKEFYIDAFKSNPDAKWIFGIDGLPEESHKYRIHQDGKKLYEIMLESKNYLKVKPIWQYIIFKYNQKHVNIAMKIARENGVNFIIINSSRWTGPKDTLRPSIKR
jgi:MoaA/NifB/PqqE/SkfB family radical SAM enzyme